MEKTFWNIYKTFFKVGTLLLGGGYVILPLLQSELIEKRNWIDNEELCEFYALSQSIPGLIAANVSIFVGYKLKRTYGGAILSQDYPLERDVIDRRNYHVDKKMVIAVKAMTLIKEREAIFLDISTTNIELAKLLAKSKMQLTVVSNMIDILQLLAQNPKITAIGTGGIMYPTVNGFLGSAAIQVIRQYSFDRAFLGSCGVDMTDFAVTTSGVEDGLTKKAAVQSSRHKYVVMEREKFYFNESYKYTHFDDISGIITDEFPDDTIVNILRNTGVKLL